MRDTRAEIATKRFDRFVREDEAQDLMEYGLLASLIATFLVGTLTVVGEQITDYWAIIVDRIQY